MNKGKVDFSRFAGTHTVEGAQKVVIEMTNLICRAEIDRVREIHGDGYDYALRKGDNVVLSDLKDGQSVCASQVEGHHVLLIEKK